MLAVSFTINVDNKPEWHGSYLRLLKLEFIDFLYRTLQLLQTSGNNVYSHHFLQIRAYTTKSYYFMY